MKGLGSLFILLCLFFSINSYCQVGAWESIEEGTSWLNKNVKEIHQNGKNYEQEIKNEDLESGFAKFTSKETDSKGKSSVEVYEFYYHHLDPIKTIHKIKGTAIDVFIYARDDLNVLKSVKDGKTQGFNNVFSVKCDDIQQAKDVVDAVNFLIENSEDSTPSFEDVTEAKNWLAANIKGGNSFEQKFQFLEDQRDKMILDITDMTSSKKTTWQYIFYPNDFQNSSCQIGVSGENLVLTFLSLNEEKVVKIFKDGVQQKFNKSFEAKSEDAKMALEMLLAFRVAFGDEGGDLTQKKSGISKIIPFKKNKDKDENEGVEDDEGEVNRKKKDDIPSVPLPEISCSECPVPEYKNSPSLYEASTNSIKELDVEQFVEGARPKGLYRAEAAIYINGPTSSVKMDPEKAYFIVKLTKDVDPRTLMDLNVADVNKKSEKREFVIYKKGMFTAEGVSNQAPLAFTKIENGIFIVRPKYLLAPGEYFFSFAENEQSKTVYCFTIK